MKKPSELKSQKGRPALRTEILSGIFWALDEWDHRSPAALRMWRIVVA
jgi:hypothetical protein